MSNGAQLERLWKLETQVNKLILDGKRSPQRLLDVLQSMLQERFCQLELYLHPKQKEADGRIKGFDLDQHLRAEGLYERALSLEDVEVKNWLENPETYPEEYKSKAIFLWKSQRDSGGYCKVAYLLWRDGRVIVYWDWLEHRWHGRNPVLLASS